MPIAMISGGLLYKYVGLLSFLTPFLIAVMLFITFCNISFQSIRFSRMHFWLLLIQGTGSIIVYLLISPFNVIVAQGAMICILAPTATSAPVITGMLGGNVESLTAYSLSCNLMIAFFSPVIFALIGEVQSMSFVHSIWIVFQKIFMLLFLPFIGAILLKRTLPRVHNEIRKRQSISFYLWSIALIIITGKTILFIVNQENPNYMVEITISLSALVICVSQFLIGRKIGRKYNDTIAGGQGLGQKNTILAIWMAQTYLNPISSIGPGTYILWQNIVNSYQVWRSRRKI